MRPFKMGGAFYFVPSRRLRVGRCGMRWRNYHRCAWWPQPFVPAPIVRFGRPRRGGAP